MALGVATAVPNPVCRTKRRVLVLGGWSPGPLDLLRSRFRSEADFEEPTIPMPPAGLRWCLNPFWALLILYAVVVLPLLMDAAASWTSSESFVWLIRVAVLVGSLAVGRLLVAGLVWFAIRDAMRVACGAIRSFEPDVLVGFSWGGGIACWLLARRSWSGPTILLAPTVMAMASLQCTALPKLPSSPQSQPVHVFHADFDGFCPESQARELRAAGCEVHVYQDNHVLCDRDTVEGITRCLRQLFSAGRTDERSDGGYGSGGGRGPVLWAAYWSTGKQPAAGAVVTWDIQCSLCGFQRGRGLNEGPVSWGDSLTSSRWP